MMEFLVLKEKLKGIYGKHSVYINLAYKFVLVLTAVLLMNNMLGARGHYNGTLLAVLLGAVCAPLPTGGLVFINGVYLLYQVYLVSLEGALVLLLLILLMAIAAFGFKPGYGLLLLLTPMAFALNIPYIIPLSMGLLGGLSAILPVTYGIIIYYLLVYINENTSGLAGGISSFDLQRITQMIDYIVKSRSLHMTIFVFAVTLLVVYFIRKLTVDYAWSIAIGVGSVVQIALLLVGDFVLDIAISIPGLLLGMFFSILLAFLLQFIFFAVDYSRTEYTQFEDDDYVYFVKAVPKIAVTEPQVKIQKFNTRQMKNVEEEDKKG